uniref:Uncharacterized protein n=1 Tax=Populus alba TaxID=43335 RepID=A0A4U5PMN3_POPAL|nr:hypothetical protein D5086_0000209010 [Populus alba]
MVATLLNLMDGISRTDGMLDSIDPALRRPRRHGRETEIGNTNRLPGKLKLWDTLFCLKRYARSKKSDYSSHSKGSSIAYEGCSDSVVRECDCSTGVGDMLRYSADSAFSNTSYLHVSLENPRAWNNYISNNGSYIISRTDGMPCMMEDIRFCMRVSWENPPSSCCNGTVSEIEDKIENGIIACPGEELMVEEESMLIIVPEDFEMAMMKVDHDKLNNAVPESPLCIVLKIFSEWITAILQQVCPTTLS